MKRRLSLLLIVVFTSLAFNVNAQSNRNLHGENARIRQGVRSGELTGRETVKLKREENKLKREAVRYKTNDGHIGPVEKRKLKRDNRKLSRDIRRQKHDAQDRP